MSQLCRIKIHISLYENTYFCLCGAIITQVSGGVFCISIWILVDEMLFIGTENWQLNQILLFTDFVHVFSLRQKVVLLQTGYWSSGFVSSSLAGGRKQWNQSLRTCYIS